MAGPEIVLYRLATPITLALLAIGFHLFLRGHNAPGGGFIAGLIIAVAALLVRLARQHELFAFEAYVLVPLGLLVALLTGVAPMLVGRPFLTSAHGHLEGGPLAAVEWATAALFDLGVFTVVVGVTVTIIDLLTVHGGLGGFRLRERLVEPMEQPQEEQPQEEQPHEEQPHEEQPPEEMNPITRGSAAAVNGEEA